jgi:PHP family Zn ribbon phosphoesterase
MLNDSSIFGDQVQVDEAENIIFEEKRLLISAISKSFEETERVVHGLNGLFIPAHINRTKNSIYSQLGFLPVNMKADALEISKFSSTEKFGKEHPEIMKFPLIKSSDAHYPDDIGSAFTSFYINEASFDEIRKALKGEDGRKFITE